MLNIDTRLLSQVDENELWLLAHIVKRFNERLVCWPTNKTLCTDTGWSLKKMQSVKGSLISKGILIARARYMEDSQSSNEYMIDTEYMGVFVPAKRMPVGLEDAGVPPTSKMRTPPKSKSGRPPESESGNKVLTSEVLNTLSSNDDSKKPLDNAKQEQPVNEPLTGESGARIDEPNTSGAAGPQLPAPQSIDEIISVCYKPFIDTWCAPDRYPGLLTMPKDGAKVKNIIRQTCDLLKVEKWEVNADNVLNVWKIFVENLHRTWGHFKDLSTIDSKYKSLFYEIKNGGNLKAKGGRDSWESEFSETARY